jgi:hypothetical protein
MKKLLATSLLCIALNAGAKEVVPFIADDYRKAVAQAKAKNVPIFVETWAPW